MRLRQLLNLLLKKVYQPLYEFAGTYFGNMVLIDMLLPIERTYLK